MQKSIVYEVAPAAGGWRVRMPSDSLSEAFESKSEAVARARRLAARNKAAVRVLSSSGAVEAEYGPPEPGART